VILGVADGELRIRSVQQAFEGARSIVRRYVGQGTNLVDELITERREAARLE
jgi:hypothetical protein